MIEWKNRTVALADLDPWEFNPRFIEKEESERLLHSHKKFGQAHVILVDPDLVIIDGHQRYFTLRKKYGIHHMVEVRVSSRHLTEDERKEITVYLHDSATGRWNLDMLADWDPDKLADWGFNFDKFGIDFGENSFMHAPSLSDALGNSPVDNGDIMKIGRHTIGCGDALNKELVSQVRGASTALFFADISELSDIGGSPATLQMVDDVAVEFDDVLICVWSNPISVAHHWQVHDPVHLVYSNSEPPASHGLLFGQGNVYVPKPSFDVVQEGQPGDYPEFGAKSVQMISRILEETTQKGDRVFSPFLGCGNLLLACERTGRSFTGVDCNDAHVSLSIERLRSRMV